MREKGSISGQRDVPGTRDLAWDTREELDVRMAETIMLVAREKVMKTM